MTLKMFTIRDQKSEAFNTPFFQPTHGEAERMFRTSMNNQDTIFHKYPEDFDLYYLGEIETKTGKVNAVDTPQHMLKGIVCIKAPTLEQNQNPS